METIPDTELVARARSGDKDAFGELIERHGQMARRIAARMVADGETARELVQEAMLQAFLSLDRLRDNRRFRNWFYGIVLNVCRGYIRDRKAPTVSLAELAGGLPFDALPFTASSLDPQEVAEARELHRTVLEAVNMLPRKSRAATVLFYYEQLTLREIAAILGVSVVAVKSRLHGARLQLRERLLASYPRPERPAPLNPPTPRRIAMKRVTIADVIQREKPHDHACVVILREETGPRALCIWVGPTEATAIAMNLRSVPTDRPMTYNFTAALLQAANAELEEVRIEALKGDTFYALARVRTGDTIQEVDARPSDAIALAACVGAPVYVSEEVLGRAGMDVPEQLDKGPGLGRGLEGLLKEWDDKQREVQVLRAALPATEEDKVKSRQEFWAFVLGVEGEQ
ncbi:MAG: bifunctional nuclease domain-containing protein [Chloroflexia bacterium]